MKKKKAILVVEDDPRSREYLTYLLAQCGYEVAAAADGVEAREKVAAISPDLIVSDILMPRIDGIQLVQKLRTDPATANIPVIFYSGSYSGPAAQELVDATGATQHVAKPADPQVILKAIQDALVHPPSTTPKPVFDASLLPEQQVRIVSEELMRRLQELTATNTELNQTRRKLEEEIGARKQAGALLLKSEEQYRLLFEENPNPMWVFELETLRFLTVNSAAMAAYGYSRQEFLGMTLKDIRPDSEHDRLDAALEEAPIAPATLPRLWKHRKKDGSLLDTEVTSHPIRFEGRTARLVLAQDVTERRSLEAQLREAQKMEAIGQLASGVAHDFNNLLGIIMGSTELALLRLENDSPIAKKLMDVKAAAQRATGLTRQLLLFSRQEINEPRKVDLNSTVAAAERFLRRLIHENVEIVCSLSEDRPAVTIDPGHLEQILMNLVVNARDAMPKGGSIRIETGMADLTAEPLDPSLQPRKGLYALLAVHDTGEGMDAGTKARIFEPFFTTKERGKGTGLGLATVHGIVKQANGHISVYSEVGRGTAFKIFLPLSLSAAGQPAPYETNEALQGTETILLVEDEPALRTTIREFLEESGYKVLEGGNGQEALAATEQFEGVIDLLLSDMVMPGMSVTELLDRVVAKYPDIRVLLMTGYTDDALVRQSMTRSGGVMQKPFTGYALLQKVYSVLSARKVDARKHKILVADDDPIYKEMMTDMLRSSGFEVLPAEVVAQAASPRAAGNFDLAVLDVQMPQKDGLAVCKKLRADPMTANIPIIVVSGTSSGDMQQLAMDTGASVFLRKPFVRDEFLAAVNTLLARATRAASNLPR